MYKGTERRLVALTAALVVAAAGAALLFAAGEEALGVLASLAVAGVCGALLKAYTTFHRSVRLLLEALQNGDYSVRFVEGSKHDVNATLNAVKEILIKAREGEIEHERFLSLVVAAIPTGIVIADERDFVRVANTAALGLLGMSTLTHIRQLEPAVRQALDGLAPGHHATVRVADERQERQVSLGLSRVAGLRMVTMQNIAGELQENEMLSWARLIRVMTHEIMNSIAPITSLAETMLSSWESMDCATLQGDVSLQGDTIDAFAAITDTARGLQAFVESYRRFAGVAAPVLEPVALAEVVESAVRLSGLSVSVETTDSGTVMADRGQIGQVLLNLLKNAAEAGATHIGVRVAPLKIEVWNDGEPVPDDVLPQIFVPFFTTKATGTGVGLSISRHIMRLHGGNLAVAREQERTVFSLEFGE